MGSFSLARFDHDGAVSVAVVVGDRAVFLDELAGVDPNVVYSDYARWRPSLAAAADRAGSDGIDVAELALSAPVAPRQVLQAGANYRTHVLDLAVAHADPGSDTAQVRADAARELDRQAASGLPYVFIGLSTIVASPESPLVLPSYSDTHDWELELAAVIGSRAFRVAPEDALDHVFGYTIVNDITTREYVMRKDIPTLGADWFRSKNAPGFLPTGPVVVPREFVADPQDLRVRLDVNGVTRQDESTADMIVSVARVVAAASQIVPLLPGDLVLTGSPAGNGMHYGVSLQPGDEMVGTITGLGVQIVRCVAE
jgi:2,4-diketo-3-deoxy-L-fuconate hydrolase